MNHCLSELVKKKLTLLIGKPSSRCIPAEDFDKLISIVVAGVKKHGKDTIPCEMPDEFIVHLNKSFESNFDMRSVYFTDANKVLYRFVTQLNNPSSKESLKKLDPGLSDDLLIQLSKPLIQSGYPAEYWKMYRDVSESFEPAKVIGWDDYINLRKYFLEKYSHYDFVADFGYENDASFRKAKQKFNQNQYVGLINTFLFSLISNSFVADISVLKKLRNISVNDIDFERNRISLKLTTSAYEQNYSSIMIDVRTAIYLKVLIYQWKKDKLSPDLFGGLTPDSFNEWLKELCSDAGVDCMSLKDIVKYTKMAASFFMPPYTVCVFANKLRYVSLDNHFFERVLKRNISPQALTVNRNAGFASLPEKKYLRPRSDVFMHQKCVYEIYRAIDIKMTNRENLHRVTKKYNELYEQIKENESSVLLAEWLIYGLGGEQGNNPNLKPSTVKDYFTGFAKDLLALTYDTPLGILGEDDMAELIIALYETRVIITEGGADEKVAEGANSKKVEIKIKHFFDWYRNKYRREISNSIYDEINLVGAFKSKIRNSIITVREFELFLESLDLSEVRDRLKIRSIFILGFFAGLRISEIMKLRKNDVVFGPESYIFVRQTKSFAGRRKVPIHYLIPFKYLRELIDCHSNVESANNVRIFSKSPEEYKAIRTEVNSVVGAMKRLLNDDGIVFHSLRHSFVSILFLRYYSAIQSDFDGFLAKYFGIKDPFGLEVFDKGKLRQLFGVSSSLGYTNDMLWKMAMITGHLSPETTIMNYIHTLDLYIRYRFDKHYRSICGSFSNKQILNLIPTINSFKALKKKNWDLKDNLKLADEYMSFKVRGIL